MLPYFNKSLPKKCPSVNIRANWFVISPKLSYLEWFKRKDGFPKGKLGIQLETVYEIKLNGLDEIIHKLKKQF